MESAEGTGRGHLAVELLPARHGDAILLTWGGPGDRHRLLVDAGPAIAYPAVGARLAQVAAEGPLDLLVLTHVDADHIEGMILLVNDAHVGIGVEEVWFNGWRHLGSLLAGPHGEILTALIAARRLPWNARFGCGAVSSDAGVPFPVRELPGGLRLTVLAPTTATLHALQDAWLDACAEAGLMVGSEDEALALLRSRPRLGTAQTYLDQPPVPDVRDLARSRRSPDRSVTNASTIVLLAEYCPPGGDVASVLLCGDTTPASLRHAVGGLLAQRGLDTLPLTALTVPHHGSERNITRELVRLLPARHYLFSSDGSYHQHPHDAAMATVVENAPPGAELVFNYAGARSLVWDDDRLRDGYRYTVRLPASATGGVLVELGSPPGRQ